MINGFFTALHMDYQSIKTTCLFLRLSMMIVFPIEVVQDTNIVLQSPRDYGPPKFLSKRVVMMGNKDIIERMNSKHPSRSRTKKLIFASHLKLVEYN